MKAAYIQSALLMPMLLVAAHSDLRHRFISNRLVGAVAAAGVMAQMLSHGSSGAGLALTSAAIGAGCLLPLYLLGGMAAGDIKLTAATGMWLSPATMTLMVAITSLFACAIGAGLWLTGHRSTSVPYAVPIAIGTGIALLLGPVGAVDVAASLHPTLSAVGVHQ